MKKLLALALAVLLAMPADAGPPYVLVHTGTVVTTSPTAVDTTASHIFVKVWSNCSQTAYLGWSASISISTGIPLPPYQWVEFDIESAAGNRLYAVVASGTCDLRTLEKR